MKAISRLRRHLIVIASVAAATLPVTLRAQECNPLAEAASQSPRVAELVAAAEGDKLIVSGRVTGSDCQPLAGALIEVWSASAQIGASATTDANGRFFLTLAAAPGPLQVRVSHGGHTLQTRRRHTVEASTREIAARVQRGDAGVLRATHGLKLA